MEVQGRPGRSGEAHAGQSRAGLQEVIGRQAGRTRNGCARLFFAGADAPLHRKAK